MYPILYMYLCGEYTKVSLQCRREVEEELLRAQERLVEWQLTCSRTIAVWRTLILEVESACCMVLLVMCCVILVICVVCFSTFLITHYHTTVLSYGLLISSYYSTLTLYGIITPLCLETSSRLVPPTTDFVCLPVHGSVINLPSMGLYKIQPRL